jgi:large subunit ribosomal protein LX
MKAFRVKGTFFMGDRWQDFTKEEIGEDENSVTEHVYSLLGSKHRVKRAKIQITEVTEIGPKDITDSVTLYKFKKQKGGKK